MFQREDYLLATKVMFNLLATLKMRKRTQPPAPTYAHNLISGAEDLRSVFARMGMNDRDLVALSGLMVIGNREHGLTAFNNDYYVSLLGEKVRLLIIKCEKRRECLWRAYLI